MFKALILLLASTTLVGCYQSVLVESVSVEPMPDGGVSCEQIDRGLPPPIDERCPTGGVQVWSNITNAFVCCEDGVGYACPAACRGWQGNPGLITAYDHPYDDSDQLEYSCCYGNCDPAPDAGVEAPCE